MHRPAALIATALLACSLTACAEETDRPSSGNPAPGGTAPGGTVPGTARAQVAPPAGRAPADPYAVGVRTLRMNRGGDRPLRVTLWYPATGAPGRAARSGADPARGRFPVVLFSHGLTGAPADYRELLVRWAAAGFVVAAPAYPNTTRGADRIDVLDVLNQPADASYVITNLLALDGERGDPLRGRLDTERVAAAGHSAGGVTTVGLFTRGRDPRLDAGVVLAGSSLGVGTGFTGPAAPLLFVHGGRDDVVSYAAGKAVFDAVPWPKAMLTLPDGDHGRVLAGVADPTFRVVADTTANFLRWSLYGDPAAKRRLAPDAAAGGVAELDDRL